MAIKFGGVNLQQRVIKKVQSQINQKASTQEKANPSDIEAFKTHLSDRRVTVQGGQAREEENSPNVEEVKNRIDDSLKTSITQNRIRQTEPDTSLAEKANSDLAFKVPGDQILETLEAMSKNVKQTDSASSSESTNRMDTKQD